jgi:hypothetical protein
LTRPRPFTLYFFHASGFLFFNLVVFFSETSKPSPRHLVCLELSSLNPPTSTSTAAKFQGSSSPSGRNNYR